MTNFVEDIMQKHVSVRAFQDTPLTPEIKNQLINAAKSGSSSNFVQAFSIIEITDQALRQQLTTITKCEDYVMHTGTFYIFVADLYRQSVMLRAHNQSLAGIQNMEALLVSVIDTAIAAENMAVAAESLGLGICFIGGVRNDLAKIAELLHLPAYTVPLFGMTIGVPKVKNEPKPRLPKINQVAENSYASEAFTATQAYDDTTSAYYASRDSNAQKTTWTMKNLAFFGEPQRTDVAKFLKAQGFTLA